MLVGFVAESIICVSADRPFLASSRNRFSQTPRRAPAHEAIIVVVKGPYSGGQSHQRQPLFSTCTMPLMTRRSSTRSTPRTFAGRRGSIRSHCVFVTILRCAVSSSARLLTAARPHQARWATSRHSGLRQRRTFLY